MLSGTRIKVSALTLDCSVGSIFNELTILLIVFGEAVTMSWLEGFPLVKTTSQLCCLSCGCVLVNTKEGDDLE